MGSLSVGNNNNNNTYEVLMKLSSQQFQLPLSQHLQLLPFFLLFYFKALRKDILFLVRNYKNDIYNKEYQAIEREVTVMETRMG